MNQFLRFFLPVMAILLFSNLGNSQRTRSKRAPKINKNTIDKAVKDNAKYSMLPPIDVTASSIYETASFGLG